jgi:thymidylate synthase (FAD)
MQPTVTLIAGTWFAPPRRGLPWEHWETDATNPADAVAEFAGRLCYQSWDRPNPSTRSNQAYLRNILEQEHFSVLEHSGFTVAITGVSRSFSHELVRHRHLSFSQLSQRFVDEASAGFVVPPLFRDDPEATAVLREFHEACLGAYRRLLEIAERKLAEQPGLSRTARRKRAREAARCVLPNMTETQIVVTGNHRAWREFLLKRASPHADAEMREVAMRIFEIARSIAPGIYQDLRVREDGQGIERVRRPAREEVRV